MRKLSVALLLWMGSASLANAEPVSDDTARLVCEALDRWPSEGGVNQVVILMRESGYTTDQIYSALVDAVPRQCPRHAYIVFQTLRDVSR